MRVGLIARGEDRGLGLQTWEWYRHMAPERTLLVDLGDAARGFAVNTDRYPDALHVKVTPGWTLPEQQTRAWLDGLDVVYTAETFYDDRFPKWAADAGVATVCHVNPEFFTWHGETPAPSVWWTPSCWRREHLPAGTRQVPVPVPLDRWPEPVPASDGPIRWLHLAGHRALADRNGTLIVLQALRSVRRRHIVTLATQDARLPHSNFARSVEARRVYGNRPDYWTLYADHDVLLLPRRYGGLCLPALEAQGAGLAVLMPDALPQSHDWPAVELMPAKLGRSILMQTGSVTLAEPQPHALARLMDSWADQPERVAAARNNARAWAVENSWDALRPLILDELAHAVECR